MWKRRREQPFAEFDMPRDVVDDLGGNGTTNHLEAWASAAGAKSAFEDKLRRQKPRYESKAADWQSFTAPSAVCVDVEIFANSHARLLFLSMRSILIGLKGL